MKFAINAATNVWFGGDRFLHGIVRHQFSGNEGDALSLVARARQYSSFIILVGTIPAPDEFEPKIAVALTNKDDLTIPLLMETIPSPKEFKDAISSLSLEQQRFAELYRGMQLAATLFGIVIIQIKTPTGGTHLLFFSAIFLKKYPNTSKKKLLNIPYDQFDERN